MNEYYEQGMPSGRKPQPTTDTETVKRFIKDKYVKKLWVDEDEDHPVQMYKSGEIEKRKKKEKKKDKAKKEKKEKRDKREKRKEKEEKEGKKEDELDLIDFKEPDDDGFGDFQDGKEVKSKTQNDDFGDLIGGGDSNDFGDFVTPEDKKVDDEFGDFISPGQNNSASAFNTAPSSSKVDNNHLINNLSSLYNQSAKEDNKYSVFENLQNPYPQYQSNSMFYGMNMNGGTFGQTQTYSIPPQHTFGFPDLTHQNSYPPHSTQDTSNLFSPPSFPMQPMHHQFGHAHMSSSTPPP